jgi:hypothetical protein
MIAVTGDRLLLLHEAQVNTLSNAQLQKPKKKNRLDLSSRRRKIKRKKRRKKQGPPSVLPRVPVLLAKGALTGYDGLKGRGRKFGLGSKREAGTQEEEERGKKRKREKKKKKKKKKKKEKKKSGVP